MDTMEMICPRIPQREGKSMQSGGGSLSVAESRASSVVLKNLLSEGGKIVLPAPTTVSVSMLPIAKSANHTAKNTLAAPRVGWNKITSTHTVSNLNTVNHITYPVSIATSNLSTTTSAMFFSDLSLLTGGSGSSTRKKKLFPIKFLPRKRSGINDEVARSTWHYSNHVSKVF